MQIMTGKEKLAGKVSLTLAAGMLTAVPAVQAAPVLDAGSNPYTGGVDVNTEVDNITAITSTATDNIIKWHDFSVNQGEKVIFDAHQASGDTFTAGNEHNYLNVVTSDMTSQIYGTIEGGKDVYIVNPNGINIGEGAIVDVGNLYLSTRNLDVNDVTEATATANMTALQSPVNDTSVTADVVNQGTLKADKVVVEGNNITFFNSAAVLDNNGEIGKDSSELTVHTTDVTASANSDGILEVGHEYTTETTTPSDSYNKNDNARYISSTIVDGYDATEKQFIVNNTVTNETQNIAIAMDGNYILRDDIDLNTSITPIGTKNDPFTGSFNGNFHTVKNITANYSGDPKNGAGLFGVVKGADTNKNRAIIRNLGVENATVNSGANAYYAGAIAGSATNAQIENVYVAGDTTLYQSNWSDNTSRPGGTSEYFVGGIVGYAKDTNINSAYTDKSVTIYKTPGQTNYIKGGGIVGVVDGTTSITNVYSLGNTNRGIAYYQIGNSYTVKDGYTTNTAVGEGGLRFQNIYKISTDTNGNYIAEKQDNSNADSTKYNATHYQSYAFLNDQTGEGINVTKGGTNTTWRIYEGQSLPMLRAFMTAKGTAYANYSYDVTGVGDDATTATIKNGGQDINAGQYAGNTYKLKGEVTYSLNNANATVDGSFNTGIKDVAYYTDTKNSTEVYHYDVPRALVYGGQQGYDIVGGNLTITRAPVQAKITAAGLDKVYDGESEKKITSGGSSTDLSTILKGVVAGDSVALDTDLTLVYTDNNNNAVASVGSHKAQLKLAGNTNFKIVDNNGNITSTVSPNYKLVDQNNSDLGTGTVMYTGIGNIHPRSLVLDVSTNDKITKPYDGTTDVAADSLAAAKAIPTIEGSKNNKTEFAIEKGLVGAGVHSVVDGQSVDIDTNSLQVAYDSKNAGDRKLNFTGLKLSAGEGTDVNNYRLVDKEGTIIWQPQVDSLAQIANAGTLKVGESDKTFAEVYGTAGGYTNKFATDNGHIDKRQLSTENFYWTDTNQAGGTKQEVVKNYDGNDTYTGANDKHGETAQVFSAAGDKGVVSGEQTDLTFTVNSAAFTDAANGTNTTPNATDNESVSSKAKGVAYNVTIGGDQDVLNNYTFGTNADDSQNAAITVGTQTIVTGDSGTINRRELWLTLGQGANADKDYNGTADVDSPVFNATDSATTNVTYSTASDADAHKIINNNATITVTGQYGTGTGGTFAANANVNRDSDNNVIARNIQYTVTLADNGTVGAAGNYVVSGGNTIDGATGTIRPLKITAVTMNDVDKDYDGTNKVTGNVTINDATVKNSAGNEVGMPNSDTINSVLKVTNAIGGTYNGFTANDDGSHVARDASGNVTSKGVSFNKEGIASTNGNYDVEINSVSGRGTINPITVSDFDLTKANGITKTYDGTKDVLNKTAQVGTGDYDAANHLGTLTAKGNNNIKVNYTVTDAEYKSENSGSGAAQDVYYTLNIKEQPTDGEFHDYTISTENININDTAATKSGNDWKTTFTDWGTITPKDVTATITATPEKVYDNSKAVTGSGSALLTINGLVDDKDKNDSTGEYDEANAGTRNVTYTVKINTADQSNYNLTGITGPNGYTTTQNLTNKTATVESGGKITPKELMVTYAAATKIYDGTANVTNSGSDAITPTVSGLVETGVNDDSQDKVIKVKPGDGITGLYGYVDASGKFNSTSHVNEATKAQYSGIELLSNNYTLNLDKGTDGKYTAYGNGTITPLHITNDYDLKLDKAHDITKVYDGTANVAHDGTAEKDASTPYFVKDLYATTGAGQKVYFSYDVAGATYKNAAGADDKNVAYDTNNAVTSKNVTYSLSNITPLNATAAADGDAAVAAGDIVVDGGTASRDFTKFSDGTAITGTITPKSVTAEVIGTPTKTYNNNTYLPDANAADADAKDKYIKLNGVLDDYTATGNYDDDNAGTKNVTYTVNLGSNAGNYTIDGVTVGQDADGNAYAANATQNATGGSTFNVTDGGKINKAQLAVGFNPNDKDFDNNPNAKITADKVTVTDTNGVNEFNMTDLATALANTGKISGQYGKTDADGNFTADKNVSYRDNDPTKAIIDKDMRYVGIDEAMNALDADTYKDITNNYEFNADKFYTAAEEKGKINRLSNLEIKEQWQDISKTYDATSDVLNPEDSLKFYATIGEETVYFDYDLAKAQYYKANTDTNDEANLTKNVGDGLNVKYSINSLDLGGNGWNYQVTDEQKAQYSQAFTRQLSEDTEHHTAKITPLAVTATTVQNDKIYNGTADADASKLTIDPNVLAVMARDNTTSTVNAVYANVNANADKDGKLLAGQTNGTVNYTVALSGDDNVGSNYTLKNAYTGTGNIMQRVLTIEATGSADKMYDATDAASTDGAAFDFAAATDNTGVVTGETVAINTDNVTGKYDSANVARDANKNVAEQNINYTGFAINNPNYVLGNGTTGTDKVVGKGTITPRKITADLVQTTGLDKEYDGTSNVTEPYRLQNLKFEVDNSAKSYVTDGTDTTAAPTGNGYEKVITVTWADTDDNGNAIQHQDTVNITLQKAVYAVDDGAGGRREVTDANEDPTTGALGVDYVLGWDDKNYELVPVNLNGTGMIKRRTITLDNTKILDAGKTYDGTDSVVNPADNLIPAFRHSNNGTDEDGIVAGDNLNISFDRTVQTGTKTTQVPRQVEVTDAAGNPVLDDEGNKTYTTVYDEVTEPVYGTIQDAKYQPGQQVLREQVQATDEDGNLLYEADGTPKYVLQTVKTTDENGNAVDKVVDYTADQAWLDESVHNFNHIVHKVIYNFTIDNPNYKLVQTDSEGNQTEIGTPTTLDADGNVTANAVYATTEGKGTIDRANITANANSVYASSDNIPESFSGTVRGVDGTNYGNDFEWQRSGGATESGEGYAKYPIYGWYKGNTEGAYGMNYYFTQAESNAKALNVSWSTTPTPEPQPEPEPEPTIEPVVPVTPTPVTPTPSTPVTPTSEPEPVVIPTPEPEKTVTPTQAPETVVTPTVEPTVEPAAVPTIEPEPVAPLIDVPADVSSVTSFTPDSTAYTQASHDFSSAFNDNAFIGLTTAGSNTGDAAASNGVMNLTSGGANTGAVTDDLTASDGANGATNALNNPNTVAGTSGGDANGGMNLTGDSTDLDDSTNLDGSNNLLGFKANNDKNATNNGDMSLTSEGASVGTQSNSGTSSTGNSSTGKAASASGNGNGYYTDRSGNSRNGNGQIVSRGGQTNGVRISSEKATKNKMASINIDVESDNVSSADEEERLEEERRRNRQNSNNNNKRNAIGFQSMGQGINLSPGDIGKLSA